jgi:hypothetical protein
MADSIDWTDQTLRPLDELARLAFPDGGVTGETLRRRARQGKLVIYRPGKAYLASLSGVRVMIENTRVVLEPTPRPIPAVPNLLGPTEMDLSRLALDRVHKGLDRPAKEAKRLRDEEERARTAPARRLEILERRGARARAKYRKMKAERAKGTPT